MGNWTGVISMCIVFNGIAGRNNLYAYLEMGSLGVVDELAN